MLLKLTEISICVFKKKMSSRSFVQTLNHIKNKVEWKIVEDDYDYNQEIATSSYGDMLHDHERNKKFGEALKKSIEKFHSRGQEAHVLDIGTGTGLLSMLAVRYGANSVTACEAFLPMANCAISIIKENNLDKKIKIIKSHSTNLTVGDHGDLKRKANILISEVFDTELIGEGAIKTFNHAFENLLTEDAIVIPSSGTVFAQVIESTKALKWNKLQDWLIDDQTVIKIPKKIQNCSGAGAVHDIQLSEFNQKYFKALSNPIPVFRFNWAKNQKIPVHRKSKSAFSASASGKAQIVFMWWELNMDEEGDIVISCAPVWEHPEGKGQGTNLRNLTRKLPWRDHWMQAVYFLTDEVGITENESFHLISSHDEYSFWFQVEKSEFVGGLLPETKRPICECSFHFLLSRSRIGGMNDDMRRNCYLKALRNAIGENTVCVVLGDVSLLALLSAKLGAKKVYVINDTPSVREVYDALIFENETSEVIKIFSDVSRAVDGLATDSANDSFDLLILSEPYFRNSILQWDNLTFWYSVKELSDGIKLIKNVNSKRVLPVKGRLRGCAVQFDNLWKIATPLKTCESFSMKIFDDLIRDAKEKAENYAEAQPLWEYPGLALSEPLTLFEFDFTGDVPKEKIQSNGKFELKWAGRCDGIALWMEYDLGDDCSLGFGPVDSVTVGEYITWDMYERQGVHLFRGDFDVQATNSVNYKAEFDPEEAEVDFYFGFE